MLGKKKIKIAVVEDDLFFNKSLVKYITTICDPQVYNTFSFDIKSYTSADEAIQELEDDLDLMILDFFLMGEQDEEDELSGNDVLRAVKKHCPNCRVILMSGHADFLRKEVFLEDGVFALIDKKLNSKNRLGAILQAALQHDLRA